MGGEDTATLTPAKGPQLLALEKTESILIISVAQRTTAWSLGEEQRGRHTK